MMIYHPIKDQGHMTSDLCDFSPTPTQDMKKERNIAQIQGRSQNNGEA
jgi:hypothetical protein